MKLLQHLFSIWLLLIVAIVFSRCNSANDTRSFPDFEFMDTDSVLVNASDIPTEKGLLLIYFRSDCEHCHHTALQLKETFQNISSTVWMVTGEDMDMIRLFEDMSGLYDFDELKILRDYHHNMHTWFSFTSLPFIVLFDKNGKVLQTFEDLPNIATIDSLLHQVKPL
jgi:thioredoxin-related protein